MWYYVFVELTSSLLTPQNREKKQIAKLEVCSPFKIHHYMYNVWLVCETQAKILLSDPETSLMTACLLSLRQSPGWSHGNHQFFPVVRIILKLPETTEAIRTIIWKPGFINLPPHNKHLEISIFTVITAEFHLQLYTNIKSRSRGSKVIQVNQIKGRCTYTSDLAYRKLLAKPKTV